MGAVRQKLLILTLVHCLMHLAESAAQSGSSQLHSSLNFGSRN